MVSIVLLNVYDFYWIQDSTDTQSSSIFCSITSRIEDSSSWPINTLHFTVKHILKNTHPLMCEARPFYHRANTQTCRIRLTNQLAMCVFGMWEEHLFPNLHVFMLSGTSRCCLADISGHESHFPCQNLIRCMRAFSGMHKEMLRALSSGDRLKLL